jgi:hypothetical protein
VLLTLTGVHQGHLLDTDLFDIVIFRQRGILPVKKGLRREWVVE